MVTSPPSFLPARVFVQICRPPDLGSRRIWTKTPGV
jgi:hypothetical protein